MESVNSAVPVPTSVPFARVKAVASSSRTRYRPVYLLSTLLILLSIHTSPSSNVAEALTCTSPSYDTVVQPGQKVTVSWSTTSSDLSTYSSLSAILYCMDLDGMAGGTWRTAGTLFQGKGMSSSSYSFSMPNCGSLVQDLAIRLVAQGSGSTEEDSCYFSMTNAALVPSTQAATTTTKTTTTTTTTTAAAITTVTTTAPQASSSSTSGTLTSSGTVTSSTLTTVSNSTATPTSGTPTSLYPEATKTSYLPFPPLPPLDTSAPLPSSVSGLSNPGGSSNTRSHTLAATFGSIGATAALIAVISMLVRRRRQSGRRRSPDYGSRSLKDMLRIKGHRSKGSRKSDRLERSFYLMREESDDEDYGGDGDDEVTEKATKYQTRNSVVSLKAGPSEKPLIVFDEDEPERPADAHLDRSQRGSVPFPFIYSDDDFTMSSMRSSCETSSVVREYWAASMAARAERRMEGYPASTDFCSSASSQSRKADILSMDAPSFVDSAAGVGAGASTATRNSVFKKPYRNTINSIHSYIRRSMSMSIASLRSGESYTDDESWYTHPGFRSSINAEFLDHLNIKSLRSAQRQLEYYTYYYRQNPTMSTVDGSAYSRPFSQQSVVTSVDSQRISSAPSLTSTNDPFQTFDSNEIVLDLNPSPSNNNNNANNAQGLPPPPPLMPVDGNAEQRSNSALLRSFPSPPVSDDSSSSVSSLQLDSGPHPERR